MSFSSSIPTHLFNGSTIESIVVGSNSLKIVLDGNRDIILLYYGAIEDRGDWLYRLPLCGENSVQELVGQTIERIFVKAIDELHIILSDGRTMRILHDDPRQDLMRFSVDGEEYFA